MSDIGGLLIGMQYGARLNAEEFARERARLQQAMVDEESNRLSEIAQTIAAELSVNAVVRELTLEANGQPFERRHSDPDGHAARGVDYLDTAEDALNRISSGRLSFSDIEIEQIKGANLDVREITRSDYLRPRRKYT